MNNYEKLYWLTRLDSLQVLFGLTIAVCVIIRLIYHSYYAMEMNYENEEKQLAFIKKHKPLRIITIALAILAVLGLAFVPSRNEAILIMAGGKTLDYVQSDTSLSKIPAQTTRIVSEYLEQSLEEMKRENKPNNLK